MNNVSEKTQESHDCKLQLRFQKGGGGGGGGGRKQDFTVRQKSNANESSNSAVKREDFVSKVVGPKKQARKQRSDSNPDDNAKPRDVSVKQSDKGLTGCRFKTKL